MSGFALRWLIRGLVLVFALALGSGATAGPAATTARATTNASCPDTRVPLGALPPAVPIWCQNLADTPATFQAGANTWLDEFNTGPGPFKMGDGYRVFDNQEAVFKTQHWRQNNHWMMDLRAGDDGLLGGGMLRPDRAFRFQNGRLIVEADVAAGIETYGGGADIWPEIVVTSAPQPTGKILDALYAYGQFGGHWSFGCRLQPTRVPVCSLYRPQAAPGDESIFGTSAGRVWEMSNFEHVGTSVFGGQPGSAALAQAWRVCKGTDPDRDCRDRFRLEMTKSSVTIFVNGVKYFEQAGLKVPFPDELTNGSLYTYFAGWEVRQQDVPTIRFHWDRLAINPESGLSAAADQPAPAPSGQPEQAPGQAAAPAPAPEPTSRPQTATTTPGLPFASVLGLARTAARDVRTWIALLVLLVPAAVAAGYVLGRRRARLPSRR